MAPAHNISVSAADEVADSEGTNGGPSGRDTAASEDAAQTAEPEYDDWELDEGEWAAIAAKTP